MKPSSRLWAPMVTLTLLCVITIGTVVAAWYSVPQASPVEVVQTRYSTTAITQPAIININTADKETLTQLPGIGEVIAGRIIDYRSEHGDFKAVEDLLNVKGIGEKTLDNIREQVTVS